MIRERIPLPPGDLAPAAADILKQQGAASVSGVSEQAQDCARRAREECVNFMRPQGILQEISRQAGLALLKPEGVIHPEAPLPAIMTRAEHLALFGVTLGTEISLRITTLFTAGDYPLAAALDAAASLAADGAALAACRAYAARVAGADPAEMISSPRAGALAFLPYSPGYCGWAITGQRPLFAALTPDEIGLTLNESCVMDPLKSVSGILLGGPPVMHLFRPDFPFCTQCATRDCLERMDSVQAKGFPHE